MNPDVGSAPSICATLVASCFPSLTHKVRMVVASRLQDHRELEMGMSNSPYPCHWPLVVVNLSGHHHTFVYYLEPTGFSNLVTHICRRRHCRNESRGGGPDVMSCLPERDPVWLWEKALCRTPLARSEKCRKGPWGNGEGRGESTQKLWISKDLNHPSAYPDPMSGEEYA